MKRLCFLLITTLLLTSCGEVARDPAEVREQSYDSLSGVVTAHYSDRAVSFELESIYDGDSASVTVTAPAEIAGIVVTVDENRAIGYDGVSVEAGPGDGLSPVEFMPVLRRLWRDASPVEAGTERIGTNDSETDCMVLTYQSGGAFYRTWFDAETLKPLYAELTVDDIRTLYCEFEVNEG